jgi:hypothetical protein
MNGATDRRIERMTIGCVAMLTLIAGTVSYLHMHLLVELHGQPGWAAALTSVSVSVDMMIVAAFMTLLAESWGGRRRRRLPAVTMLVVGSGASQGANEAYAKVSLKKYKPMAARNEDRNVSSGLL